MMNYLKLKQSNILRQLKHGQFKPFSIALGDGYLNCNKMLRLLPGKRLVVRGEWKGQKVVAKLFFSGRIIRHVCQETKGSRLLGRAQIKTPKILYSGITMISGLSVVLYEYIPSAIKIESVWMEGRYFSELKNLLSHMQSILIKQHLQGMYHRDLHPHNFIVGENEVYMIDASEVKKTCRKKELSIKRSIKNLAQLYSQLSIMYQPLILKMFQEYCRERNWKHDQLLEKQLLKVLYQLHCKRMGRYLAKSFTTCSGFINCRKASFRSACARVYFSDAMKVFFQSPEAHMKPEEILKNGNSCTAFRVQLDEKFFVVKRYNIKNWKHLLKICWRKSRAEKSWCNAICLDLLRLPSIKPAAYFEKRWAWLFHGCTYFIYEYVPGERLDKFFINDVDNQKKLLIADRIKAIFRAFQSMLIVHDDMKSTNFIVQDGSVHLLDLDAMWFSRSKRRFKKEHQKDVKRFMKNWDDKPEVQQLFQELI